MEAPPCTGGVMHMSSEDGRRLCITGLSLVDPEKARGQRVNVWAEVGQEKRAIGNLSSMEPEVAVPPVVLGGEFILRHDLAVAAAVLLHVRVLGPSASDDGEALAEAVIVLGENDEDDEQESSADDDDDDDDDAVGAGMEYELLSEEDMAERYDSDNEGGGSRRDSGVPLFAAPPGSAVPDGELLGPARFAAVENTAAFMRLAAAEAAGDDGGKEIVVLYRYTRFSRPRGGLRGVEACRRTKLHRLRFAVPPAGDLASSLGLAASSLGPLIYPGLFRRQLQDLWTRLATPAAISAIPPRAARLQVIVDAGILRREDCTPERMAHMGGALAARALDAWPAYYHVGMELQLPEPVPPASSRRIGEDEEEEEAEECCVCFEVLESGLAAWPGCGHVFHGACAEKTLARSEMCPLCRHKLSDPLAHKNTNMRSQSAVCS